MTNVEDFGANEWLVELMRERYEEDPDSVDEQWVDFFEAETQPGSGQQPAEQASAPNQASAQAQADKQPTEQSSGQSAASPDAGQAPGSEQQAASIAKQTPAVGASSRPSAQQAPTQPDAAQTRAATPSAPAPSGSPDAAEAPRPVATVEPKHTPRTDSPAQPGRSGLTADVPLPAPVEPERAVVTRTVMKGAPMRTAKNMDASLSMPTATSVRAVPMKLVIDNRATINNFLRRSRGGKVSFTHLIAYAMVQALKDIPAMNSVYALTDGKPTLVQSTAINLGVAIDTTKADGTRQLLVPVIKDCDQLNFAQFLAAYEALVHKARSGKLEVDDFAGATVSITNPGGIGTNLSVPRLMNGQGVILGVGNIDYPAEFEGTSSFGVATLGVSKVCTLTSTYDHRVIQGAQSGEFLKRIHELLLGADGFYTQVFQDLRIPYAPFKWARDISVNRNHEVTKQARVFSLVQAYRILGHLAADIDPLEYRIPTVPDLELETHGLTIWDLERQFPVGTFGGGKERYLTLREIVDMLRDAYCHTTGVEYMHIEDPAQRAWLQERFERPHTTRSREEHLRILDQLSEAEVFETFLQTKYVGQTRFSLEGAESMIVVLAEVCEVAAEQQIREVCIGMPHRGRLNVLTNIAGKLYSQIFREFDNRAPENDATSGDVKYHLGVDGEYTAADGSVLEVSVAANPSHLEAVDPVLLGIARAKNDRTPHPEDYSILPVLMHGDASFAGQGIVYETLQMSQLRPYKVGGSVHLVVNNQVGFTTSPVDARSSHYATDVAKTVGAPIFHVNGDDPEACANVARIAMEFRDRFHKDVVIDLVSYRRRGHNEGDDPSFTQPLMYDLIEAKRPVRKLYTESLIGRGDISMEDAEQAVNHFRERLEEVFSNVRNPDVPAEDVPYRLGPDYPAKPSEERAPQITQQEMNQVAGVYTNLPEGFSVHPKVLPQLERRAKAIKEGPIDWATAELLAFGSLLMEHRQVRLVGQDARRGTFSQRFGAIVDRKTNEAWVPLKHLTEDQAPFDIFDSLLSEYGALGFEYGYSAAAPDALVCWEAQYGDFVNGAQTISDEFITSGSVKWQQKSGVVLLLPHGYEGAGPDHSSARIERWLEAACEDNIAVCQPSTPASYFHLLRQHAYVNRHRPLVVATPKSMLRVKAAVSQPEDIVQGTWEPALGDPTITDPSAVQRILLCSGRVRWDLVAERTKRGLDGKVAILALERLYPLPTKDLADLLADYPQVSDIRFVQDEPENQGPWWFLERMLTPAIREATGNQQFTMRPVTRPAAAAPSVGSHRVHAEQQRDLLERAFAD